MPEVVTGSLGSHATTTAAKAVMATSAVDSGTMQAVYVSIMAFAIVFAVLIVVAVLMILLGKIVDGVQGKPAVLVEKGVPTSVDGSQGAGEIDEETVAAISAAIGMCMKGRRFRVASLAGYDVQIARWAMAGRQRIQPKKG